MHVWIIEMKYNDGQYYPLVDSARTVRSLARYDKNTLWEILYPDAKFRIVKYTSTKGK